MPSKSLWLCGIVPEDPNHIAPVQLLTCSMPLCRVCAAAQALKQYEGPTAFAIPGNHDWIDGLETYTRHIQHKGWLGGWLLPQVLVCELSFLCPCWCSVAAQGLVAGPGWCLRLPQ